MFGPAAVEVEPPIAQPGAKRREAARSGATNKSGRRVCRRIQLLESDKTQCQELCIFV